MSSRYPVQKGCKKAPGAKRARSGICYGSSPPSSLEGGGVSLEGGGGASLEEGGSVSLEEGGGFVSLEEGGGFVSLEEGGGFVSLEEGGGFVGFSVGLDVGFCVGFVGFVGRVDPPTTLAITLSRFL